MGVNMQGLKSVKGGVLQRSLKDLEKTRRARVCSACSDRLENGAIRDSVRCTRRLSMNDDQLTAPFVKRGSWFARARMRA